MKRLLLLFIAILCSNSALFSSSENSEREHTKIAFSQPGVDALITYLAEGNTVKNIVALNNLTSVEDINFVMQEVALMRAAGLVVEKQKIENLVKIDHTFSELAATLRALTELGVTPETANENKEEEPVSPTRQDVEQLEEAIICMRQVIALCSPENIDDTVEYALDIVSAAQVSAETKKALIERVRHVHNSAEVNTLCDKALVTL